MLMMTRRAGQKIVDRRRHHDRDRGGRRQHGAPRRRRPALGARVPRGDLDGRARRERGRGDRRDDGDGASRRAARPAGAAATAPSYSAVSPSAIRSAASLAASTRPRDLGVALPPAAEHVGRDDVGVGRVRPPDADPHPREVGRPEALLERLQAVVAGQAAAEPRLRMSPNGRSISSWRTSTRSRSRCSAPRAGPAERPASFMYVCGQSIATRGPPGPVRPSVNRPA